MSIPWKLPEEETLSSLDEAAKSILQSARNNAVPEQQRLTHQRIGPWFGNPATIDLEIARRVVAREFGLSSWAQLEQYFADRGKEKQDEHTAPSGELPELRSEQLANQFLDLVVIHYSEVINSGPHRFKQALQLLEEHPSIRQANIYTAAAIGDTDQIDAWLQRQPELLNQKGGYFHWSPLMYATYARLPGHSSHDAACLLLEKGADANAYYMWNGQYKFTALTGAFGQGEGGPVKQPEHPEYMSLCRKLLEKGANANDSQAAYNRCFTEDNSCLELLLEFGLNASDKNNWLLCEDDKLLDNPNETMQFHLIHAIRKGFFNRVKLLVENGANLESADNTYETRSKGKKPYEAALIMGQIEIAEYLAEHGADTSRVSLLSRFQGACCSGNKEQAQAFLKEHPSLAEDAKPLQREMLCNVIEAANTDALQLMLDLGFNLNDNSQRTPLHEAALGGRLDLVKILVDAGADTTLREPGYCVPPIGFALHAEHQEIIDYLDAMPMDIFTASIRGNIKQLESLLAKDPELLEIRFKEIRPSRPGNTDNHHENDWATPLAVAALSQREEAVELLLDKGANVAVSDANGTSLLALAENHNCSGNIIKALQIAGARKTQ